MATPPAPATPAPPRRRRWLRVTLVVLGVLVAGVVALVLAIRHPMPSGAPGPEADALARAIERSVNTEAWGRTGAVRWTMGSRHHLWDRARHFARVRWADDEVLLDLRNGAGVTRRAGQVVGGDARAGLLRRAYEFWANDSFWLNPLAKLFDPGVTRSLVRGDDGRPALLVRYSSGGVTPGDSYLWLLGADGRPRAWRMWVSVLPVTGAEASWEGWTTLPTGAVVSTSHRLLVFNLRMKDVAGAATLAELEPGADPFAALVAAAAP